MKNVNYFSTDNPTPTTVTLFATVESSSVKSVYWSNWLNERGHLLVTFNTGATYRYIGVSAKVFSELISAESVGKKFNELVRGQYEYELAS